MRPTSPPPLILRGAAAAIALVLAASAPLAGQEPGSDGAPVHDDYRHVRFSPRSGPPGTTVTVNADELPAITPVYVTLGGTSSGFEVLGEMRITNLSGELSETVSVPSWASREDLHLFVVMNVYFGRLAASSPFHVTDADGRLQRKGEVEASGDRCVALRGDDDQLYALSGAGPWRVGDRVVVEGTVTESTCPGDITIQVTRRTDLP